DQRLRSGIGRKIRRPSGKGPPAETDPRDPRPRGSPQVAATDGHSLEAASKPRRNADEIGVYNRGCKRPLTAKSERIGAKRSRAAPNVPKKVPKRSPAVRKRQTNRYRGLCHCGEHAWAVLTRGFVTFVSPEDAGVLSEANWHVISSGARLIYAARKKTERQSLRLHRVILGGQPGDVDHKDHDGTNNRRSNLRPASHSQNIGNSRHR